MDKDSKKKNIIVRIVCVICSFGLWLYINNIENPVKEYKINNVPVEIENSDVLKELKLARVSDEQLKINVTIEGPAKEVYKVKKNDIKIKVNLEGYALKKGENRIPVEIYKYPNGVSIKNNDYLRVSLKLDNYAEKNVNIKDYVSVDTKQGYYKSKTEISPSTVTVSGAQEYVNQVAEVRAIGKFIDINSDIEKPVKLKAYSINNTEVTAVNLSLNQVIAKIPITKGKFVDIKVNTNGSLPSGFSIKEISTVKYLQIYGDRDTIKNINTIETEPIDLSNITDTKIISAKLKIPEGVIMANNEVYTNVTVKVEKDVTKNIKLQLSEENKPDDLDITYDKNISIVIVGKENDIENVKESDIKAAIDLSGVKEGNNEVSYTVIGLPDQVKIQKKEPEKVNITAVKKQ